MVITRHFVYLHFQRTAGNFFRRVCREYLPPAWEVRELPESRYHAGYGEIPPEGAGLPVICFLRNPWDWYVSWYEFTRSVMLRARVPPARRTHPWVTLFGEGRHDFRETVTRACTRREGKRAWELAMRQWDVDLYTGSWWLMTGQAPAPPCAGTPLAALMPPAPAVQTGTYETFKQDFAAFVDRNDIPAPREFMEAIRSEPPHSASVRGPYRKYYDDELRGLVAGHALPVIERYGYEF